MKAVRPPVLAGTWYPAEADRLRADVTVYLAGAVAAAIPPGSPLVALAPHAGYRYSGPVAGRLFGALAGRRFAAVFILAPCHRQPLRLPALSSLEAFATPLGEVPLETDIAHELAATGAYAFDDRAHAFEHAVEIQLPLLQCALPAGTPIVPILFPPLDEARRHAAARALDRWRNPTHLLLVSSDLTHYGDAYGYVPFTTDVPDRLEKLDAGAIRTFLDRDPAGLLAYAEATGITMCGLEAAAVALDGPPGQAAPDGPRGRSALLAYERSADRTGEQTLSVSYAAAVICAAEPATDAAGPLAADERALLVAIAHAAVAAAARGEAPLDPHAAACAAGGALTDRLREPRAAFVTLTCDGELRGCVGNLEGSRPLAEAVADAAAGAAVRDDRFAPVQPDELPRLRLEVSVLSPLRPVDGPSAIVLGRDGILLASGRRRAVFLPQVPVEQGWDLAQTLDHLALKAGLDAGAWRRDCTFQVFTAEVFAA